MFLATLISIEGSHKHNADGGGGLKRAHSVSFHLCNKQRGTLIYTARKLVNLLKNDWKGA